MTNKIFDPNKPVQTQEGRKARIVCRDVKLYDYNENIMFVLIADKQGYENGKYYHQNGNMVGRDCQNKYTLINVEENDMNKKFDPTKPVQTQDGHKARILATNIKLGPHNSDMIVALITDRDGFEHSYWYYPNGRSVIDDSTLNLVNIPVKYSMYLNIYKDTSGFYGFARDSLEQAKKQSSADIKARIKIEFEEGQFDD